jgi:hypothetical protein
MTESSKQLGENLMHEMRAATCAKLGCHSRPTPETPIDGPLAFGGNPWATQPSPEGFGFVMPGMTTQPGALESADLHCRVGIQGRLEDCVVDWESQLDVGLGATAIRAAKLSNVKPRLLDGTDPQGLFAQVTMIFAAGGKQSSRAFPQLHYLSTVVLPPLRHPLDNRTRQRSGS